MSFTETQYTVKVPLNPTGFPTNDKVVIWDTSEGRFQLRDDGGCQLVYQWNTTSPVTQAPSQGQLSITTSSFSASTSGFNYIGFSLTSYTGNDLTNYLTGITNASFVITLQNDPSYFMAFNANILATSNGVIVYDIIENTFSSSSPPASGTPENGELLCVSITPISVSSSTGGTSCENIESIGINFSGAAINDNITFTIASGLTINTGINMQLTYTPDPSIFVIGEVTNYNVSTGSITINLTYISSDGYCCGAADENDVCYYLTIENDLFIFQRTLFVDPNGDDVLASSVFPYGGTLHQPFKTIQSAIQYIDDNYTYGDVTVHVFAGAYNVTTETPIRVGIEGNNTNIHLYLEDGVRINCMATNPSTSANNPDYYFILQGGRPSISGYGLIKISGDVGATQTYIDAFRIINPVECKIQVKRIDSSLRETMGSVFYYPYSADTTSSTYFEGEVLTTYGVKNSLLDMSGFSKTKTFEFGHNSTINLTGYDSAYEMIKIGKESDVIVRGTWYIDAQSGNGTIFFPYDTSCKIVFDGCDICYKNSELGNPMTSNNLISNLSGGDVYIEVRERCITSGYIHDNQNVINISYGVIEQNIPMSPKILYAY